MVVRQKPLEKANFIVKMTGPAGQFWQMESAIREQCPFSLYKTYLKVFKDTTFTINIYFCNCIILLRHGFPEEKVTFNSSCCRFIYTLLFKPIHNERIMISFIV